MRRDSDSDHITEGQFNRGIEYGIAVRYRSDGSCASVTEFSEGEVSKWDLGCKEYPDLKGTASEAKAAEEPTQIATTSPAADSAQAGPLHGSITFSQETDGGYAWGIAWSFDSSAGAEAEALGQCREYGGTRCAEAGWFQEACVALAIGDGNGYGAGWGTTTGEAERDALAQCRAVNDDCRIEVARCSQSEQAGGRGRDQATDDAFWYAFAVINYPDPDGSVPDWYFWADGGPKATREELDTSYCATVDNQSYSCRIETCCMTEAERDSMSRSEWHGCPSG